MVYENGEQINNYSTETIDADGAYTIEIYANEGNNVTVVSVYNNYLGKNSTIIERGVTLYRLDIHCDQRIQSDDDNQIPVDEADDAGPGDHDGEPTLDNKISSSYMGYYVILTLIVTAIGTIIGILFINRHKRSKARRKRRAKSPRKRGRKKRKADRKK
jgi:hypothetical protein